VISKVGFEDVVKGAHTEKYAADRAEHKDQCNPPSDLWVLPVELLRKLWDREGDGEEVEGVPSPAKEANQEENIHCWKLSSANNLKGLAALFIGGFRVGMRVAMYRPTDIFGAGAS